MNVLLTPLVTSYPYIHYTEHSNIFICAGDKKIDNVAALAH